MADTESYQNYRTVKKDELVITTDEKSKNTDELKDSPRKPVVSIARGCVNVSNESRP